SSAPADAAGAAVAQPNILPRSAWGADESLRFDSTGKETWAPTFWPIQKLIVHHTATRNADPDPTATIRSISEAGCLRSTLCLGHYWLFGSAGSLPPRRARTEGK